MKNQLDTVPLIQTSNNLFHDCYHLTTPSYSSAQPYDNHHITSSYNHLTIDTVLQLLSTWPKTSFSMKPTILTCLQPSRNSSKGPRWKHRFSLYLIGSHTQLWERQSLQSLKEQSLCSRCIHIVCSLKPPTSKLLESSRKVHHIINNFLKSLILWWLT